MTDPTTDTVRQEVAASVGRFEGWLSTIRAQGQYFGPAFSLRHNALGYCGPGYDWRYEGYLDAYGDLYRATGHAGYLDYIEEDLRAICQAQLRSGAFKNSYFDRNPCEGGMPHEPIMLAAACRARKTLLEAGRAVPDALDPCLERYAREYALKYLWNKQLETFNDWLTSDFHLYSSASVAALLEFLVAWQEIAKDGERLERFIVGAAESLLKLQGTSGPLEGAIPISSGGDGSVNPYSCARCVPGFMAAHAATGTSSYREAAERIVAFLKREITFPERFPHILFADRPPLLHPRFLGAMAGTVTVLRRAGVDVAEEMKTLTPFLIAQQRETGAYRTALGFGGNKSAVPDWRDVLPVCGWQDKIYALLASLHGSERCPGLSAVEECEVHVDARPAMFFEDDSMIKVKAPKRGLLYAWRKKSVWPERSTF